jgi:hypothetical protein
VVGPPNLIGFDLEFAEQAGTRKSDVSPDRGNFGSPLSCHLRLITREQGGEIVIDKVADTLDRHVGCRI